MMAHKSESTKTVIARVLSLPNLPRESDVPRSVLPDKIFTFVNKPSFLDVPYSESWLRARDDIMLLLATETINDVESSRNIATSVMRRLSILHEQDQK